MAMRMDRHRERPYQTRGQCQYEIVLLGVKYSQSHQAQQKPLSCRSSPGISSSLRGWTDSDGHLQESCVHGMIDLIIVAGYATLYAE